MGKAITLSDDLYGKLEQVAKARGVTIETILEGLINDIASSPEVAARRALTAGGLPPSDLSAFADLIQPGVDYETVRKALASKAFRTSLSEIIIADRG
jgi:hypothetical protein